MRSNDLLFTAGQDFAALLLLLDFAAAFDIVAHEMFVLWQMTGLVVFEYRTSLSAHVLIVTIKHCIFRDLSSEAPKRV